MVDDHHLRCYVPTEVLRIPRVGIRMALVVGLDNRYDIYCALGMMHDYRTRKRLLPVPRSQGNTQTDPESSKPSGYDDDHHERRRGSQALLAQRATNPRSQANKQLVLVPDSRGAQNSPMDLARNFSIHSLSMPTTYERTYRRWYSRV